MASRDTIFQIRISDEERRILRILAEEDGLTSSDYVRQFVRREWIRRYGNEALKVKKKKP